MNLKLTLSLWTVISFFLFKCSAEDLNITQLYPTHPLDKPVALVLHDDFLFIVEQRGQIKKFQRDQSLKPNLLLDISHRELEQERGKFEEGLLGLAFHPNYQNNKKFYISYTQQFPKRLVISEITGSYNDSSKKLLKSERVVLEIPQPFWNHNSGNLTFGKDGHLFIGVGDGGYKDDTRRLAQNLFVMNGKILCIDVNSKDRGLEYHIPKSNPFVDLLIGGKHMGNGIRHEIYAYGIRNPWGLYYDKVEDQFWFADVGQGLQEEVNLLTPGSNYGWSYREGFDKFERRHDAPDNSIQFTEPLHTYSREQGVSITGGFVYRGNHLPELKNKYIFGDWSSGKIFALSYDKSQNKSTEVEQIHERKIMAGKKPLQPTCIAPGYDEEVYILSWHGEIYQLTK
jgi:quinoprotein glucose dehydrogenase